jgi:hypothetical protein
VAFDVGEDNHDTQFFRKRIDGAPNLGQPVRLTDLSRQRLRGWSNVLEFPRDSPQLRSPSIESQPPGHPNEPCPEAIAMAKVSKSAVRLRKGVLGHILSVLPVAQDAIRNPKGEGRALDQARFELPIELLVHA